LPQWPASKQATGSTNLITRSDAKK
jgi:hypothetical protein